VFASPAMANTSTSTGHNNSPEWRMTNGRNYQAIQGLIAVCCLQSKTAAEQRDQYL
jgi:hypothetical protein